MKLTSTNPNTDEMEKNSNENTQFGTKSKFIEDRKRGKYQIEGGVGRQGRGEKEKGENEGATQ